MVSNLTKSYGNVKAVDDISFEVHHGEIVGFLEPNGAGKTTTMRMITSYLFPTSGTISIEGKDIQEHSLETRKLIGYRPEPLSKGPGCPAFEIIKAGCKRSSHHDKFCLFIECTHYAAPFGATKRAKQPNRTKRGGVNSFDRA